MNHQKNFVFNCKKQHILHLPFGVQIIACPSWHCHARTLRFTCVKNLTSLHYMLIPILFINQSSDIGFSGIETRVIPLTWIFPSKCSLSILSWSCALSSCKACNSKASLYFYMYIAKWHIIKITSDWQTTWK